MAKPKRAKGKYLKSEPPHVSIAASLPVGVYDPDLHPKERAQKDEYRRVMGRDPEEKFKPGTKGHKQFNYHPTQKRKGELPKGLF